MHINTEAAREYGKNILQLLRHGKTTEALGYVRSLIQLNEQMAEALDEMYAERRELRAEIRDLSQPGFRMEDLGDTLGDPQDLDVPSPATIHGRKHNDEPTDEASQVPGEEEVDD
jgi:hypothetical protein